MPATQLFWIDGPWPGKLALAARPPGGAWLADEMAGWRQAGLGTLLSLLTEEEEAAKERTGGRLFNDREGLDARTVLDRISAGRGIQVPETAEQRHWIDYYAGSLAGI